MTFYQAMQLSANTMKPIIKETTDEKLKKKYIAALIAKDVLCLLFCMIFISIFSGIFGSENSIVGVVTVIAVLTYRVSNLGFDVKQSTFTILGIFAIFIVAPYLATTAHPIIGFLINFASIMTIVILSCHNTALCNQSILVLSYVLIYGYKVSSMQVFIDRIVGLAVGGIIVSIIFYCKSRKAKFELKISDVIKDVDFSNSRTKWQLKLAIGVSLGILIGELLHLPRTMWIGAACISVLQPVQEKMEVRTKQRPIFVIIGCLMFAVVYIVLPASVSSYIGMMGGLVLGLCATYQWQTVFNCFGALSAAVPIMGLWGAVIMRIISNLFGAVYSKIFNDIFDKIDERISNRNIVDEIVEG